MRKLLLTVFGLVCIALAIAAAVVLRMRHGVSTPAPTANLPQAAGPTATTNRPQRVSVQVPPQASTRKPSVASPVSAAVATLDWANLPAAIRLICGQDTNKSYAARITAAHQLGANLSPTEIQALYGLLHQKSASQGDLSPEAFAALKNDILDALIAQTVLPPDLGKEIVGMYRDRSTDPLWRDYCVQHFTMYVERLGLSTGAPVDPDRAEIFKAFHEALQEKDSGIAGTALLSLYRLSNKAPEADLPTIGQNALAMAKDATCAVQTRVTAVGICGLTGKTEILPEARILAQTAEVLPLRLSAIATIGSLGGAQDKELLEGLRAGSDARLYKALDAALKKLNAKDGSGKL